MNQCADGTTSHCVGYEVMAIDIASIPGVESRARIAR
jgi:hypothetical protein